jgi:nucleoside-diphosphate-sugar epimerase
MASRLRVLVTGARGFVGRAVTRELLRRFPDADVVAVSRRAASADDHPGPALDLSQSEGWRQIGGPYGWIFHLAAEIPSPGAAQDEKIYLGNVLPCLHLLEACRRWAPSRIVYVSSISVYPMGAAPILSEHLVPKPDTAYGAAKLAGEHLLALAGSAETGVVSLRLSSVYGPGQRPGTALPLFIANAAAGKPIGVFAGGARSQDFLHVSDAARGIVGAAASQATGVFNLGSGSGTSMRELARIITDFPGWNVDIVDRGGVETSPSVQVDISKARQAWGYAPEVSLVEGIGAYHASLLARLP